MADEMPKGVRFLQIESMEQVQSLWEKFASISGLFDDFHRDRADLFVQKLKSPNTVWLELEDGNGLYYLTNVIPNLSATGHFVFWDRKLKGREELTMDVMRWLMSKVPLVKVNSYQPDYAKAARRFAENIGMKREGIIRRWSYSDGKLFDMFVYGMTSEEAFDGSDV